MKIVITECNGTITASCLVPTQRGGEIRVEEHVDSRPIEEELTLLTAQEAGLPVQETGRRFGSRIRKAARKVASSRVVSKVKRAAQKAWKGPLGDLARATPQGQAAMAAHRAARRITNTADALARRDRRAQRAVAEIRRRAMRGDPRARAMVGQLRRCYANRYGCTTGGQLHIRHETGRTYGVPPQGSVVGRGWHRRELGYATVAGVREGAQWLWGDLKPRLGLGSDVWGGSYRQGMNAALNVATQPRGESHALPAHLDPEEGLY